MKKYRLKYAYWGWREFCASIVPSKGAIDDLMGKLKPLSGCDDIILLNSGRSAIRIALKAFNDKKPGKNTVLVPAYTCDAVVQAVTAEGFDIKYIDVDQNLNMSIDILEAEDFSDVLAVIAEHNYGYPIDIEKIFALGKANDFFVIDDAAQIQGIGIGDKPMGSFADAGIYSFAQSKTMVSGISGSGGVLMVNNPDLVSFCTSFSQTLPLAQSGTIAALDFFWNWVWQRYTKLATYYFYRIVGWKQPPPLGLERMNDVNASIVLSQYDRLTGIIKGKKQAIVAYVRVAKEFPNIKFVQDIDGHYIIKLTVMLSDGQNPQEVSKELKKQGIQTRLAYSMPWCYKKPGCDNARNTSENMIELPMYVGMTDDDIRDIFCKFEKVIETV